MHYGGMWTRSSGIGTVLGVFDITFPPWALYQQEDVYRLRADPHCLLGAALAIGLSALAELARSSR